MTTTYAAPATSSPAADACLLIGRIALVVIFILSGISKFADIAGTAGYIASKSLPVPTVLAVLSGTGEIVGGLLIVIGWQTRLVALALLIYTLIAAFYFHDFWHVADPAEHLNQFIHALKNLSMAGAFLMLAGSGAGRFSVDGRARA